MRAILLVSTLLASGIAAAAAPINGWYTSVFGGMNYLPDNINNTIDNVFWSNSKYRFGYNAGGRFGFQSNPMRYELEFTYLKAQTRDFNLDGIRPYWLDGYADAGFFMGNVYYDFPDMLPAISPFLGAGIGYGYINYEVGALTQTGIPYHLQFHDNTFAYQGTAGLTYNFTENYALNIDYRFIGTTHKGKFGKIFTANIAEAGVIYRFDDGSYK